MVAKRTTSGKKKTSKSSPQSTAKKKVSKSSRSKTKQKSTASKPSARKTTTRATTRKKAAVKKKTTSKKVVKKTTKKTTSTSKKAATSRLKSTKKSAAKKGTRKKVTSKKKVTKKVSKKIVKKSAKKTTKKTTRKVAPKPATKKVRSKKTTRKTVNLPSGVTPAPTNKSKTAQPASAGRKGITIVQKKPSRRRPSGPPKKTIIPQVGRSLLGPGNKRRKPLIPSGPKAAPKSGDQSAKSPSSKKIKTPYNKRELDRFNAILLAKRAELVGDVSTMEEGALRDAGGSLSHTPSHIAEQGSDAYDQSLSLDLAAVDRQLIREIDEAMQRIANKTYGICEITGEPINPERLKELPWTRLSITAARSIERHSS